MDEMEIFNAIELQVADFFMDTSYFSNLNFEIYLLKYKALI